MRSSNNEKIKEEQEIKGFYFKDEHKVSISLSQKARKNMEEDMDTFDVKKTTFINIVFANFKDKAKASISQYKEKRIEELGNIFNNSKLKPENINNAINVIIEHEIEQIKEQWTSKNKLDDYERTVYQINKNNVEFLEQCNEAHTYKKSGKTHKVTVGQYMSAVIEEYCSLPFIERERIFKKDIYDTIELACDGRYILKITTNNNEHEVYPYKIMPDPLHTQDYLTCYSINKETNDKKAVSFNIARIKEAEIKSRKNKFHLNEYEIKYLEEQIAKRTPAYLTREAKTVEVKLNKHGMEIFKKKLFNRPVPVKESSTQDGIIYVFDCTDFQTLNYFLPFGADAEIISPPELRKKFIDIFTKAYELYNK